MKRVLALPGGGIRGYVSALILQQIEIQLEEKGSSILKHYDLIGGSSTGSILASCICTGIPARETVALYELWGEQIFGKRRTFVQRLWNAKYSTRTLNKILRDQLGEETRVRDLDHKLMIFASGTSPVKPKVFKSWHEDPELLADAVTASSAAPTYFIPWLSLIDGGLWANDPSIEMYAEACELWPGEEIEVTTITTGEFRLDLEAKKGLLYWAVHIINALMHLQGARPNYIMPRICKNYKRLSPLLPSHLSSMDNGSKKNLISLRDHTLRYLSYFRDLLEF